MIPGTIPVAMITVAGMTAETVVGVVMAAVEVVIEGILRSKLRQQSGSKLPQSKGPLHFQVAVGRGGFARVWG